MGVFNFLKRRGGRGLHRPAPFSPLGLPSQGNAPEFVGLTWLQGGPLTLAELRGKVVLVNFWTYACVNSTHALPAVRSWHEKYSAQGLVVIGIHAPEFVFEHDAVNVQDAIASYGIEYAVAQDNDFATWKAYGNRYWPAHYFIDAEGKLRFHHFGEGAYADCESVIQTLLKEAGREAAPTDAAAMSALAVPVIAEPVKHDGITAETYLGFERSDFLGSPETVRKDVAQRYSAPRSLAPDIYYLEGMWELKDGRSVSIEAGTALLYSANAATVHAVLEAPPTLRLRVTVDGATPAAEIRGADVAEDGTVLVGRGRSYELLNTHGAPQRHLLRLEALDAGISFYSITFG